VEHPITEETLGCDLVRAQLDVAAGRSLPEAWRTGAMARRGHAIELRLYAEDPFEFLPRSGRLLVYREPAGPGVRVDAGVEEGSVVGLEYDPLLAKLVISAASREAAIQRARRALAEWVVLGVETNIPLLSAVLESGAFVSGHYTTDLVGNLPRVAEPEPPEAAWIAAALLAQSRASDRTAAAAAGSAGAPDPWARLLSWRFGS
jgi:acetyl/propionyl-CoA carboxylase alpha subunit